jgi:hypothetical protein
VPLEGFWSYVHDDDESVGGRIRHLARDIKAEFDMREEQPVDLFLDRDSLQWGDRWREVIDSSLDSVGFFVAVLTPRFLRSPDCRRELQAFLHRTTEFGVQDLVLPILYVDVPTLRQSDPEDDLVRLVRQFQWVDWTELRFASRQSERYRRAVAALAERLVAANRQAEAATSVRVEAESSTAESEDEGPEELDRLALFELTLPQWSETSDELAEDLNAVASLMNQASDGIRQADSQGKGYASKLHLTNKLARDLGPIAERIFSLSNRDVAQLHDVDQGIRDHIRLHIQRAPEHPDETDAVCTEFRRVRRMARAVLDSLNASRRYVESTMERRAPSREMRPVYRRLREAATLRAEGGELVEGWLRLIDESGVECNDESTGTDSAGGRGRRP